MLVARVHKADVQSEEFTVNACGCMANIDAARKSELTERIEPLMRNIITISLGLLDVTPEKREELRIAL